MPKRSVNVANGRRRSRWRHTIKYRVELRSLDEPINTCDCADFVKSGLGTCKHIERVVRSAVRKCHNRTRSSVAEVFMHRDPYVPRFLPGDRTPVEARRALSRFCGADGLLKDRTAAGLDVFLSLLQNGTREETNKFCGGGPLWGRIGF